MESIVLSPWLNQLPCWINLSFVDFLQRKILLVPPTYNRVYTIRPNDPRDDRFPPDVKEGILKILISNKTVRKNSVCSSSTKLSTADIDDLLQELTQQFSSMNNSVQQHLSHMASQIEVIQNKTDRIFWHLEIDDKFNVNNQWFLCTHN